MLFKWFTTQSHQNRLMEVFSFKHEADYGQVYCSLEQLIKLKWQAEMLTLPLARRALRQQSGVHHSSFKGRGMEFAEVREYQPGDDIRSIDWRVTARRQKPHTKLYHEEREQPVYLICEQTQNMFFGSQYVFKSVRAAQVSAILAWVILNRGDRIGGTIFSEEGHRTFKAGRSRKKVMAYLHTVSQYNQKLHCQRKYPAEAFTVNDALSECFRFIHPGAMVIIVSDFYDLSESGKRQLHLLARHNELITVQVTDPLDKELPPSGFYPVSNGDNVLTLDTSKQNFVEIYQNTYRLQQEQFIFMTRKLNIRNIDISTAMTLSDSIKALSSILRS